MRGTSKTLRVGGLFSGIGAHVSACDRFPAGTFGQIFQCEFDARTAEAHDILHGAIPNLGDITGVGSIPDVDILFWTPPCQDISAAGRLAGNEKGSGTRSSLAFEVPRILRSSPHLPKWLVMEEVPMMVSKRFRPTFDALLGELTALGYQHSWGILNAADCGVPQSRRRLFVVSRLGAPAPPLPAPVPLTSCLRDLLEPEPVASHFYLSAERLRGLAESNGKEAAKGNGFRFEPTDGSGIAHTVTTRAGGRKTDNFLILAGTLDIKGQDIIRRVYDPEGCSPTLTTCGGGNREPKVIVRGTVPGWPSYNNMNKVIDGEGCSPTLTTQCAHAKPPLVANPVRVRKLTPVECMRLQGFTEAEARLLSDAFPRTVVYRFAGNSVCVACFERILEIILEEERDG